MEGSKPKTYRIKTNITQSTIVKETGAKLESPSGSGAKLELDMHENMKFILFVVTGGLVSVALYLR